MSNRANLYCTDAEGLPESDDGYAGFFARSGREYEASDCLPVLWLALFRDTDLRPTTDEDGSTYPYLFAPMPVALERWSADLPAWREMLGPRHHRLLAEWPTRLAQDARAHVLVRTGEVAAFHEPGAFEPVLRAAFAHLARCVADRRLHADGDFQELVGLPAIGSPGTLSPFALVGGCNERERWPEALERQGDPGEPGAAMPTPQGVKGPAPAPAARRPWWRLW